MKMTALRASQLNQLISILVLMALLCAARVHADHFTLHAEPKSEHQCQLCLQNIDQPRGMVVDGLVGGTSYYFLDDSYELIQPSSSDFKAPQLRAPPK